MIDATSKQTWKNCLNPKKVTTVRLPDAKIIFTKLIQYEQILFLKGSWFLKISYAWELKKHRYKKHEIVVGSDSININFLGSNR